MTNDQALYILFLKCVPQKIFFLLRNWVFVTNPVFLITKLLQLSVLDLWYFKPWTLLEQKNWVWNIEGLYTVGLRKYRDKKVWVCGKPFFLNCRSYMSTNLDFLTLISLLTNVIDLRFVKPWIELDHKPWILLITKHEFC